MPALNLLGRQSGKICIANHRMDGAGAAHEGRQFVHARVGHGNRGDDRRGMSAMRDGLTRRLAAEGKKGRCLTASRQADDADFHRSLTALPLVLSVRVNVLVHGF
jgi:hypothetical protein